MSVAENAFEIHKLSYLEIMMRSIFAAAIGLALCSTGAAAQTVTTWNGLAEIVKATPATTCAPGFNAFGPRRFRFIRSVFRPANISDNGSDTRITFTGGRSMDRLVISGQNFSGSGSYSARKLTGAAGHQTYVGNFSSVAVTPATFSATTTYVHVNAVFTNFQNITGCTVTIRAAYVRRLG